MRVLVGLSGSSQTTIICIYFSLGSPRIIKVRQCICFPALFEPPTVCLLRQGSAALKSQPQMAIICFYFFARGDENALLPLFGGEFVKFFPFFPVWVGLSLQTVPYRKLHMIT